MSRSKRQRDWLIVAALLLLANLIISITLLWRFAGPAIVETAPGNPRFGLAFISSPDHLADEARYSGALAAGATWDRWPLYWHWVDEGGYTGPHAGGRHDYDTLIAQDLAHGLTPIAILLGTPARYAQAAPPPDPGGDPAKPNNLPVAASTATLPPAGLTEPIFSDGTDEPGPGKRINPANPWAAFVFATVERYRPGGLLAWQQGWPRGVGLRYWEVWNEPDYQLFWGGTVEEYDRLLEVAYKSIKAADPQATVILGGLAFYDQRDWFPALLRQTNGDPNQAHFDVFSFHHYLSVYNSEQLIQQARASLTAFNLQNIPIWITESGVSVWDDFPATAHNVASDTPFRATLVEQSAYLVQNTALSFYNGVERYYHFQLHDDCGDGPSSAYGLRQNFSPHACNPAQGQPRPAYAAYQLAAEQFAGLIPLWRDKQYEQDRVAFYRPADQARVIALWATQGLTVTAAISATGDSARLFWIEPTPTLSGTTGLSRTLTLTPTGGVYNLTLPRATNQNGADPADPTFQIGGQPFILVERDTFPPRTTLQPLQPSSPPTFLLRWHSDDPGSGIAAYDVYVSADGGPLELWLADTPTDEAKFTGQINHSYGFAVRARDRAGNVEPLPAQLQVTTQIVSGPAVTGVVLGPAGELVAGASVTVTGPNTQETLTTNTTGQWPPLPLLGGVYEFQASAPGYTAWPAPRQVSLTGTATITLTLAPATNAIASGDFEGDNVWNVWDWAGQINLSIDAFDGQAAARLGDGSGDPTDCPNSQPGQLWSLGQRVTISTGPEPQLSFLYKISLSPTSDPRPPTPGPWLSVFFETDGETHELIPPDELPFSPEWTLVHQDLSAWQGKTGTLQFQVVRCVEEPFSVSLDRVSLGSGQ